MKSLTKSENLSSLQQELVPAVRKLPVSSSSYSFILDDLLKANYSSFSGIFGRGPGGGGEGWVSNFLPESVVGGGGGGGE